MLLVKDELIKRVGTKFEPSREDSDSWENVTSSNSSPENTDGGPGAIRVDADVSSEVAIGRVRGLRILVLGSHERYLESMSKALQVMRVRVMVGSADESGYRTALEFRPDVIISELVRPGERGWWLFQRLKRHPTLKWAPVLLMKWWEVEDDGTTRMLISSVVERIADALTPLRVLEERISAGRPLADKLEMIGPPALTKALGDANLEGVLALNDAWNVFEIGFAKGRIVSAFRRGVDGGTNEGETAFSQFLMCDLGRWSFKRHDKRLGPDNVGGTLEELLDRSAKVLAEVFGPDANPIADGKGGLDVSPGLFHEIASTFKEVAYQVTEAMAAGAPPEELNAILKKGEARLEIERAVISLLRSGAVVPAESSPGWKPGSREEQVARSVCHVLKWIASDHRLREEKKGAATKPNIAGTSYHRRSGAHAEKVSLGKSEAVMAPGALRSSTVGLGVVDNVDEERHTPLLSKQDMAYQEVFPDGPATADSRSFRALPHDSLVPSPPKKIRKQSGRQMWLAIGIAILMGLALIAGLVVINSSRRDVPEAIHKPHRTSS
jgi:hypothetical protein